MKEVWKPVKDYEGFYEVSSKGRVRRLMDFHPYFRVLTNSLCLPQGYLRVWLRKHGKQKYYSVHQLMAKAFLNYDGWKYTGNYCWATTLVVSHKNHVKTDNRIENLEITTWGENIRKGNGKNRLIYLYGGRKK